MASVYSVSQVNAYIKNMFSQDFALNNIYIKGEVSNCKYHTSGHIYFSLKDEKGVIQAVMFAGNRSGLEFKMEDGQTVIALGSVNVYEIAGKYQLYAKEIILDGAGLLYQKFEKLKQELEEMGMFAGEYKKAIPRYATKVGIVTAKTGAAIQDIKNISSRRNPYVQLYLYSAFVQGEGAAVSIVNGIQYLDNMGVDVIIVGRGGGSIEDLWAFNEEIVAHAIFHCNTPIISAVGHETDTTIADYVADMRAPTPSAAAELAVFDYHDFRQTLQNVSYTLGIKISRQIDYSRNLLEKYKVNLKYLSPVNQVLTKRQYTSDMLIQMQDILQNKIINNRHRLAVLSEKLNGLSPLNKLGGGYAYITDTDLQPINSVKQVKKGGKMEVRLKDGILKTVIESVNKGGL